MRNSKRLLSIFLAIALLLTSVMILPAMADETGTTETTQIEDSGTAFIDVPKNAKYATAVTVLNKLGIITGYDEGNNKFSFRPDNNVTRAEFAAMLLRTLNMGQSTAPSVPSFTDVPVTLWSAGVIEAAKNMGIITGYEDGTFKPDNNVSYEEALTMIIRAISYENYSPAGEAWYSAYVNSANRLGITKDANGAVGTPATRACIAQLLYATLEVNVRENNEITDKTVMESYLGLVKKDGIIASNAYTSLDSPDVTLRDNEILIRDKKTGNTEVFRVDNIGDYNTMLGATITYYCKEDLSSGYKDIVAYTVKAATNTETIDADLLEINECTTTSIAYYKNDKATSTSTMKLDDDNIVIYNGKLYGNNAAGSKFDTDMLPTLGSVKLLNTDGDNDYDVVFIDSYEIYVVSTVTSSTYTVTDKITTTAGKSITLDYTDDNQTIKFVNTSGKELSFSSIAKNKTLCIMESNDNGGTKLYTVVIVDKTVTGEVKALSGDKCTVGSASYNFSPAASWKFDSSIAAPVKNSTYTFFLDMNGEIVGYTKSATAATSSNYGFIMSYAKEDGGLENTPLILNILTQTGDKTRYALYKNTKINGTKISDDYNYAISLLEDAAEYQSLANTEDTGARQLIKYTLKNVDGSTVIDTITTVTADSNNDTTGGDVDADVLRMYGSITSEDDAKYTSSSKVFKSGSNSVYLSSAIVFVVPEDMTDVSEYAKGSASSFKNGNTYQIEAFDISSSKNAKVIVLYGGSSATEVNFETNVFRIEEIFEDHNTKEDEDMLKVTGYENASATLKELWVSPSSADLVDTLEQGDLVRFGLDRDGYATLAAEDIVLDVDATTPYFFAWDETRGKDTDNAKSYASSDIKLMLGSIYSTDDDTIIIVPEFLELGDDFDDALASDETEVIRLASSKFDKATFFEYNTTGRELSINKFTESGADIVDSFSTFVDGGNATKVFIHIVSGTIKTVTIIK